MIDKDKRPIYEPPRVRDLSASSVSGGNVVPLGTCSSGPSPFEDCRTGTTFLPGVSGCVGGDAPEKPQCNSGSFALSGCEAGGQA
jgi:hypothetical protein